jgi:hypothetical protein
LQQGQGFFEVKNQLFTTFGFSAAGPQSCNIFVVHFFGEEIPPSSKYIDIDNFLLKIKLDLDDTDITKKN